MHSTLDARDSSKSARLAADCLGDQTSAGPTSSVIVAGSKGRRGECVHWHSHVDAEGAAKRSGSCGSSSSCPETPPLYWNAKLTMCQWKEHCGFHGVSVLDPVLIITRNIFMQGKISHFLKDRTSWMHTALDLVREAFLQTIPEGQLLCGQSYVDYVVEFKKWKDKSMEHAHHFFNLLKVSQLGEGLLKKHERNHVARRTGCMVHQSHKDLHGQPGSHTLAFFRLDREAWEVPEKAGQNLSMTVSISTEFSLFWRKFDVLDSNLKVPKVRISKMQALKQVTVSCG